MKILSIVVPGRFPTVVHDPGKWWGIVSSRVENELSCFSSNAAWWRALCSPVIVQVVRAWKKAGETLVPLTEKGEEDLERVALEANETLNKLTLSETYRSSARYIAAIGPLIRYLKILNKVQGAVQFGLGHGAQVARLDYSDSRALYEFSKVESALSILVRDSLKGCPRGVGFVAVSVTTPQDLLMAMIVARVLREEDPAVHVCLADHGYENFSLHPHLEKLEGSKTLDLIFDSIIASKDDRDNILPDLIQAVLVGRAPKGFLSPKSFKEEMARPAEIRSSCPGPVETFTPEPILFTRVSPRRCYWSRCAFCVQNLKYDDPQPPSISETATALEQIGLKMELGYRNFIFSDEALSPALLNRFCDEILRLGLKFKWACRCKLERAHTKELFQKMALAGCYEILYGLESISPRVLKLMDKYVEGLTKERTKEIFSEMSECGIGAHINLIAAFPGDTLGEVEETVDFVVESLSGAENGTFTLNRFALFPDTPIFKEPGKFGLAVVPEATDMPMQYKYLLRPELKEQSEAVDKELGRFHRKLFSGLGWESFRPLGPEAMDAVHLYLGTGHGAIFKSSFKTAFSNPLKYADAID